MTLPASGVISLQDICTEFNLNLTTAVFPSDFYSLGGAPSSGALSFADFYGRSNSVVSVTSLADASTAASRSITLPSFAVNDTVIVIMEFQGSANPATASTGWREVFQQSSAGASLPTTLVAYACENTTVANRPLTVTGCPASGHTQVVYKLLGGGVLDDTKDSPGSGTTPDAPATASLTTSVSWIAIACASGVYSAVSGGPTGYTFNANTWKTDGSNYGVITAFKEIANGGGATENPSVFTATQTSTRSAFNTLAVNMNSAAGAPATYNVAAGAVSRDNTANQNNNAFLTITANKSVTWTWSQASGSGTATCNRTSGASATSARWDLAPVVGSTKDAVINISAQDTAGNVTNWTLTLTAYQLPAATYTPVAGSYSDNNNGDTANPATYTLSANRAVTWTWSRSGSTAGTATLTSGSSGTSITFDLTSTTSARQSVFTVTANDGYSNTNFTVTLDAASNVSGPTVAMANTGASGVYEAQIRIDSDGNYYLFGDGGSAGSGVWLTGGLASDVEITYTVTGSAVTGLTPSTDYAMTVDRTLSLNTTSNPKSSTITLTFKKISDNSVLDTSTITLSVDGDGGGGMSMTL